MSGAFTLGQTDPAAGPHSGPRLTLVARVVISDVARFVADPSHVGALEGDVSYAPFGAHMAVQQGQVQLFTQTADPNLKLMTYRVTFAHGDRLLCLDGAKHVRRESMFKGWRATTTLFCRLHEGGDSAGAVLGAGILRISPAGFLSQLLSFRAIDAPTVGRKIRALATFLRFFSGELINTYLGRAATP